MPLDKLLAFFSLHFFMIIMESQYSLYHRVVVILWQKHSTQFIRSSGSWVPVAAPGGKRNATSLAQSSGKSETKD